MKPGSRASWTIEREKAILKLGKVASKLGSEKRRNWQAARDECPKENKILANFSNSQLRKTYMRIFKASQGLCMQEYCQNHTDGKNRYCENHRKERAESSLKYWNKKGKYVRENKTVLPELPR